MKKICLIVHTSGYDHEGFRPDEHNGQLRAFAAIDEVLSNENVKYVIFSGGRSHNTSKGWYSLARAMDEFFIDKLKKHMSIKTQQKLSFGHRIYEEIILHNKRKIYLFKEPTSIDTRENILKSKEIMVDIEKTFSDKLIPYFLSNQFHLKRIEILAKQAKIKKFVLISAEVVEHDIPEKMKENWKVMWATRLGFGPMITHIARKRREGIW